MSQAVAAFKALTVNSVHGASATDAISPNKRNPHIFFVAAQNTELGISVSIGIAVSTDILQIQRSSVWLEATAI